MSNLSPVLYGNRLYDQETYSSNQDPQTFNLNFSESLSSVDVLADSLTKPLSDTTTLLESYAVMLTLVKADSMTLSDAKTIMATKALSDSLSPADSKAITTTKALLDSLTSADSNSLTVSRTLADSLTPSDMKALSVSRPLSDSLSSADVALIHFTKALADSVSSADSNLHTVNKALSESMTLSEVFMVSFGHAFSEMLTVIDSKAITTLKPLTEGPIMVSVLYGQPLFGMKEYSAINMSSTPPVHVLDSLSLRLTKSLADTLVMSDVQRKSLTKSVFDAIASIDARVRITLSKKLSDVLLVQDWISIRLIKPLLWTVQTPTIAPYSTLYGQVLFGQKLYSGLSGLPWIQVKPTQPSVNGWRSYNQLESQP